MSGTSLFLLKNLRLSTNAQFIVEKDKSMPPFYHLFFALEFFLITGSAQFFLQLF